MNSEAGAASFVNRADEIAQLGIALPTIDADTMLHRDRRAAGILHRLNAVTHQRRVRHQAGANHIVLHPIAGAADVQVDLGVAGFFSQRRALGQLLRIAAAQLQCQRLLFGAVTQKTLTVAMQHCARSDHFRIQQRTPADQPRKVAIVAVSPVHHRRNAEAAIGLFPRGCWAGW